MKTPSPRSVSTKAGPKFLSWAAVMSCVSIAAAARCFTQGTSRSRNKAWAATGMDFFYFCPLSLDLVPALFIFRLPRRKVSSTGHVSPPRGEGWAPGPPGPAAAPGGFGLRPRGQAAAGAQGAEPAGRGGAHPAASPSSLGAQGCWPGGGSSPQSPEPRRAARGGRTSEARLDRGQSASVRPAETHIASERLRGRRS